jgi:hypothetical protein
VFTAIDVSDLHYVVHYNGVRLNSGYITTKGMLGGYHQEIQTEL